MKKRYQKSKEQVIAEMKYQKQTRDVCIGNRVGLLITLLIFHDVWDISKEDANDFVDRYGQLLDSYNAGNENLDEWIDGIREEYGIDLLGELI